MEATEGLILKFSRSLAPACRRTVRLGRSSSDRSASLRRTGLRCARLDVASDNFGSTGPTDIGHDQMRSKSRAAWETAARCATLAQEADDPQEREHYARLRDAWITLAKRCEPFNLPDVTDSDKF